MILAAGRGERLRPITDSMPKPLVKVGEFALIEHHLIKLAQAGFDHVVINVSHLGEMIMDFLGDGSQFGVPISYSVENDGALGTGGGVVHALELFLEDQILIVNSDVFTDYDYSEISLPSKSLAHLVVVQNPAHNSQGDFSLVNGQIGLEDKSTTKYHTFAGIGFYRKQLFSNVDSGKFDLPWVLSEHIDAGKISGELYEKRWIDVGDVERLKLANDKYPGGEGSSAIT